ATTARFAPPAPSSPSPSGDRISRPASQVRDESATARPPPHTASISRLVAALPRMAGASGTASGSVPELAENAGEVDAVGLAQPAEDPFGFGAAGRVDRVEDAGPVLGHLDQSGPPVTGVGPPPGQAPGFERVGDLGGRARRDAQMVRQFREAHCPVPPEHAQGP